MPLGTSSLFRYFRLVVRAVVGGEVGEIEKALHLFGESSEDNKAKRLRAFVAMVLTARLLFRPYM
jgi:hypothetical protein